MDLGTLEKWVGQRDIVGDLSLKRLQAADHGRLLRSAREIGVRGGVKSVYYSLRHTGRPVAFVFDNRTSVSIARDATIDIPALFLLGPSAPRIVHRSLGGSRLFVTADGTIRVTTDSVARIGPGSLLNIQGEFSIGQTHLSGQARIYCRESITIGDGCGIGWAVEILDNNGMQDFWVDGEKRPKTGAVEIGDGVWIGHHTTVSAGVTIGDGAVVASNSAVLDDVPPRTLVAGTPAKVVRDDVRWERNDRSETHD